MHSDGLAKRRACSKQRTKTVWCPLSGIKGHRIIYTLADEELLMDVLSKLRPRFETVMRWSLNLAACTRKKQMTMHTYLKKMAGSSSSSSSSRSAAEADA